MQTGAIDLSVRARQLRRTHFVVLLAQWKIFQFSACDEARLLYFSRAPCVGASFAVLMQRSGGVLPRYERKLFGVSQGAVLAKVACSVRPRNACLPTVQMDSPDSPGVTSIVTCKNVVPLVGWL